MKSSLLNNYIVDKLESAVQNLTDFTIAKKPESLHGLRLDIKKVKAVLSFVKYVFEETPETKALDQIFAEAGIFREIYIHIDLLSSIPQVPIKLINQLKRKENILIQQFTTKASRNIILLKDFQENACLPEIQINKNTIIRYFKKEGKKANKILKNADREGLHKYRKKIKQMNYVYDALTHRMQNKIDLNEEEIDKLQKKLGKWHDIYATVNYLAHKNLPTKTLEYVLKLKEKEQSQFNSLVKKLKKT